MKKAILLLLPAQAALAHDGHGAVSLFHLHGAELAAFGLMAVALFTAPALYRAWQQRRRP